MKYLKVFEKHEGLYREINIDKYHLFFKEHNQIEINKGEISKVSSFLPPYFELSFLKATSMVERVNYVRYFGFNNKIIQNIIISAFEDEWYMLEYCGPKVDGNKYYCKYFKCDTIDGVLDALKSLEIK